MATCVEVDANGFLVQGTPGCTGTSLVVLTAAEYAEYSASPLNLSVEDALQISWSIVGCWLVAVLARALLRAFYAGDPPAESDH